MTIETKRSPDGGPHGGLAAAWYKARQRYASRPHIYRHRQWITFSLVSLNAIAIAFVVFDAPLGEAAKDLPARLVSMAGAVTDIGRLLSLVVVIGIALAVGLLISARLAGMRRRFRLIYVCRIALYVAAALLSASAIVHVLKYAIGRARPPLYEHHGILGFDPFNGDYLFQSFPSAHSAHLGAFLVALALLFPRFRLLFANLALWLGMTRVIVGAHYPSDVVAGLALGAWCAFAAALFFARIGWIFIIDAKGWPQPRILRRAGRGRLSQ